MVKLAIHGVPDRETLEPTDKYTVRHNYRIP